MFPLSQKQLLISGPCLQTLAHISYFLPPCLSDTLSPSLLPEGLLFTAECLLLNGRYDRAHHKMGCKGEGRLGRKGEVSGGRHSRKLHCRHDRTVPPKSDHWMIHEVKREGDWGVCVQLWLHHCCVWASLVSAVFLTLIRKRDDRGEGGGCGVSVVGR